MAQREYQQIASLHLSPGKPEPVSDAGIKSVSTTAMEKLLRRNRFWRETDNRRKYGSAPAGAAAKRLLRRVFDATCAVAGLTILAPAFAMIALAIKLDDGGPVLYSHPRIGKSLRPFRFLKFRSMIATSVLGSPVTAPHDARVTRVGRFLRKYKLDELPQLVNVLKGEMQLVGSRPQLENHVRLFRDEYEELLQSPPGITDLATLSFRDEERFFQDGSIEEQYIQKIMPVKLQLALKYSRTRTFRSDLEIIFRTVLGLQAPSTVGRHAKIDAALQLLSK